MLAIGYPTRAYKLPAFTIAGAVAGFAGGLYAIFNGFISPDAVYWTASGDILIMAMLGGAGTLIGPAIGAGVVPADEERGQLLQRALAADHRRRSSSPACMFFPGGIWGTLRRAAVSGRATAMSVLRIEHLYRVVRQPGRHQRCQPHRRAGRAARHHRPERRRQDQPHQPDRRSASAQRRPHPARRAPTSPAGRPTGSPHGVARTFQRNNLFPNLIGDRESAPRGRRRGAAIRSTFFTPVAAIVRDRRACRGADGAGPSRRRRRAPGAQPVLWRAAPARNRHRARRRAALLLLDEPTSGMSPAETERMIALIASLPRDAADPDDRARHESGVLASPTASPCSITARCWPPARRPKSRRTARVREVYLGMAH